ncbi:serine/threonine-protein kinase [uncultured Nocardioides sp.]|uniref:serine/threonine-protein kinase n=1 Tax=uncultured Nocardioides sp. TaxID=198441 RepID=UPI002622E8E4|nr:serine/threonine-protein kinase [uncultured Nocardioides sp.]
MTQPDTPESAGGPETVGRYRVEDLIALGGTATVHRAHDLRLGRDVALKRPRTGQGQAQHRLRLLDEGRLLAHLSHPGLVRVLDAAWEGPGAPYLALELVDGPDLDATLALRRLSSREAAVVGRDLASALAYLHSEGLVHRDVKPANVLLDSSGHARLCDLGVTLRAGEPDPHGRPGHTVGSIAYLAPEQVLGSPLGSPVDIYALGLLLLESLTGRREFEGGAEEAAWARVHRGPAIPTSLGAGWTGLLASMTAREPEARPPAREVAEHLEALLAMDAAVTPLERPAGRHRVTPRAQELAATVA